jgi:serine/threonine-protein kinase RsbW
LSCDQKSLTLRANVASLTAAMEFVRNGALEANLPEARIAELDLLIEEAVMNVFRYAYPDGTGHVMLTYSVPAPGTLSVEIADQGIEFDPLAATPPDLTLSLDQRSIGGLGIFLLRTLATTVTYRREAGWNRLTVGISADS